MLSLQGGTSTADVHLQDGEQWHSGKRGDIATPPRGPGQHGSSKSASIISEWEVYFLLAHVCCVGSGSEAVSEGPWAARELQVHFRDA